MNLGPLEIGLIILAILLLFGYKKLPDASRSLGRSLRIFKGEMKGMKDDDSVGGGVRGKEPAKTTVRGEIVTPAPSTAEADVLAAEAHAAELRAAELRARAEQARTSDRPS
ncbi:sec-independent protein translocase protein TatA [Blastococcus aggregatus]|uniref:Sec-independent protein translocase protein TatA n=1 Tax=Blastococcus aggregatus TaxID=38502 RepID=A0A285V5L1_9ACTN|nr:Sec-independent protein translocase subunit TatA [Blastococcus aggregatus]SOC49405.1 sec-independent protein translocase protein TatA [Blastococcus aggregatus]